MNLVRLIKVLFESVLKILLYLITKIGPCVHSNWSKTHVSSSMKNRKSVFYCFFSTSPLYHKVIKKPKRCIILRQNTLDI